jgi:hypothetical protein
MKYPTYKNVETVGIVTPNKFFELYLEIQNQDGSELEVVPNMVLSIGLCLDSKVSLIPNAFHSSSTTQVRFIGNGCRQRAKIKLKGRILSTNFNGASFCLCVYHGSTVMGYTGSFESKVKQSRPPKTIAADKTEHSDQIETMEEDGMRIQAADNPNTILKKDLAEALEKIKDLVAENERLKKHNHDLTAENEKLKALVPARTTRGANKRKRSA